MKTLWKRILAAALSVALAATGMSAGFTPVRAEDFKEQAASGYEELSDDYIKVTVSGENGGFLIDTVAGDKLDKADDNKYLLYPAEDYDTSYTSFRVTRTDGTVEDYVFGRDYGFLGLDSSEVTLSKQGNTIHADWEVGDLTIRQSLSLLDESASQHGMVSISYGVTAKQDNVENVKVRMMLDTALGFQDYAVYELPDAVGDYQHIRTETLLDNSEGKAFDGTMFAVDDPNAPSVTAYTVNTAINGKIVQPYQVGIGHWNNLAATAFDFTPDNHLDFTNAYNADYMTADSAYALYYDLGSLEAGKTGQMATYYGVYSNATVNAEEKVAINFPILPATMTLSEDKGSYLSQVEGGRAGDIRLMMTVENIVPQALENMTVVVKNQNQVRPYVDWYDNELYEDETASYSSVTEDVQPGEEIQLDVYFQVAPLEVSEYRRFEVLCYAAGRDEELTDDKLLGSREFYLMCPGELGEVVTFNTIDPQTVYTEGTRNLYLSGQNFRLLADTTAYTTVLRSLEGGEDVVVPSTNVVVDPEKNTMFLQLNQQMGAGSYQVVFDWNETGKEDTTSESLKFIATEEPEYIPPAYGIVTIEKNNGAADSYVLRTYKDEADYKNKVKDPNNQVYLEFRGNFSVWYDEAGNITEAKAVSLAEADGTVNGTVNISNCLDVEDGSVSIIVENPGTQEQAILTNIDGKVYTTNARSKVWTGVCAITAFEEGNENTLLQYNYDGIPADDTVENSVANTNAITLLWPGAASSAQTFAGMAMEFRYCQFGMMATERGQVTPDTPKRRVIAFGAEVSPSFLIPTNFNWSERETSTLEAVQLNIAKSNYTAEQLRDVQTRYAADQEAWEETEGGNLALYVHDILFGGGFIGFNTSLEIGVPSYADGLPGIEGTLNLNIMPANDAWQVGVAGLADFMMFRMEASLRLKSYNGIPVPDLMYFHIGGMAPGLNVDGMGIFWIQGLGGGIDKLYDTLFTASKLPPITLMLSGEFALFNLMQARADLSLSLRGYDVKLSNIGIMDISLIDYMRAAMYWYPQFYLNASMQLNILDIIEGGGYIILEDNQEDGGIFWEGFATASVTTPYIPLIGRIKIGSADLGLNAEKIWGALHVLMVDMGVTYYWGGDVDFAFGKYDSPEPTYPVGIVSDIPVYEDEATGRILYMNIGTNAVPVADSDMEVQEAEENAALAAPLAADREASITSSPEKFEHTVNLGGYFAGSDMVMTVTFPAKTEAEAKKLANGTKGISLTDAEGQEYKLRWIDSEKNADEQKDANALFFYDEENHLGNITISFTEESSFGKDWALKTKTASDVALYEMKHLPGVDAAAYRMEGNQMTVSWEGSQLENIEELTVYAVSEGSGEEELQMLYHTEDTTVISGGMADASKGDVTFDIPENLPSGTYRLRVVGVSETNSVNDIAEAEETFTYTNRNQPEEPKITGTKLGGDYSIDVDVEQPEGEFDGYIATVYEKAEDGKWVETQFAGQWVTPEESGTYTFGGQYEKTVRVDSDGNPVSAEEDGEFAAKTEVVGLEAGKTYRVGMASYRMTEDGSTNYISKEVFSKELEMEAPALIELDVSAADLISIKDAVEGQVDTVTTANPTLHIRTNQAMEGTWILDDSEEKGDWKVDGSGSAAITFAEELAEGEHVIEVRGENENGDGKRVAYRFRVDATAPRLQLASPSGGAFFDETVTVEGLSEPGAVITVFANDRSETITVTEEGTFKAEIAMNQEAFTEEISIFATDAAGNISKQYDMTLTNGLIGAKDARLAIFYKGEDYTNKILPRGFEGNLELCVVSGDRSIVIPETSNMGQQAEWSLEIISGNAQMDGSRLVTDGGINGMLAVSVDKQQAALVLGGNEDMADANYTVTIPENPIGYRVVTEDEFVVKSGESFRFQVEIETGYGKTDAFGVRVNGEMLEAKDGVYTIENIKADQNITVLGVCDNIPAEAEINISENRFKEFLNKITFNLFFKETEEVTVAASDHGSGVGDIFYHVAKEALTLEEVEGLDDDAWTAYEKPFAVSPDNQYVIYAKVLDRAGNIMYVSSDGLVFDSTLPLIVGLEDGGTYYGDQTFTVAEDNLKEVLVDGKSALVMPDQSFAVTADNQKHTITVEDKAGNKADYAITIYKVYEITFVADGVVVEVRNVKHGASVSSDSFPAIPSKVGYDMTAPYWEAESLEKVTADQKIEAVYVPNRYKITCPKEQEGYEIRFDGSADTAEFGKNVQFAVEPKDGYGKTAAFKVLVNGVLLVPNADGSYTVSGVDSDIGIAVEGIADITAPEGEVEVAGNIWREFLHTITFKLLFEETQEVKITASDKGSGVAETVYYLSDEPLTKTDVKELDDSVWKAYEKAFRINPDNRYIVYVRITDQEGNITYISSDGLVLEETKAPAKPNQTEGREETSSSAETGDPVRTGYAVGFLILAMAAFMVIILRLRKMIR